MGKSNRPRNFSDRESILATANAVHGGVYDYSGAFFSRCTDYIVISCERHGEFTQQVSEHLRGRGCPRCGCPRCGKNRSIGAIRRVLTIESIRARFVAAHGATYDYSLVPCDGVLKMQDVVSIICNKHGVFNTTVACHAGGCLCPSCSIDKRTYDTNTFIEKSRQVHGDRYSYERTIYHRAASKLIVTCKIHGDFMLTANNHLKGNGCPRCRTSKGEQAVAKWLEENSIRFIAQYKFPDFSNRMAYDFFLPDLPLVIEYDGEQHFAPVCRNGDVDDATRMYESQKITDAKKTAYLSRIGMPLLRIGYMDDVPRILSRRINEL